MGSGSIVYYRTPDEAIGVLILIVAGLLLWVFLSAGSGGMDEDDGEEEEAPKGLVQLPPPPGAAGLIGCSLKTWLIFIVLALAFLCMYTGLSYDPR